MVASFLFPVGVPFSYHHLCIALISSSRQFEPTNQFQVNKPSAMNDSDKLRDHNLSFLHVFALRSRLPFLKSRVFPFVFLFATIISDDIDFPEGPVMIHTWLC